MSGVVKAWAPMVREVLDEHDPFGDIPPWVVLSLIQVESNGNPYAHRKNSQFYGLLQIGKAIAQEGGEKDASPYWGQARMSVEAFVGWCHRYSHIHNYDPEYIAMGWKGGVGTVKTYIRKTEKGGRYDALKVWLNEKRWRTGIYIDRFWRASENYIDEFWE